MIKWLLLTTYEEEKVWVNCDRATQIIEHPFGTEFIFEYQSVSVKEKTSDIIKTIAGWEEEE